MTHTQAKKIGAWQEKDGKWYISRHIKGGALVMVQEIHATNDSPTGYYTTGLIYYVNPQTGESKYTS